MRRLADCFPDGPGAIPLRACDWLELGVGLPYIIFITGRCGSALLAGLLADTGLCGRPDEYFNESRIERLTQTLGAGTFPDYFRAVVRHTATNWRFGVMVDPFRFPQVAELIDLAGVFPPAKTVFFWLTRRDLVGQAWSYAKAKKGGLWHLFADGGEERTAAPEAALGPRAAITDAEWWRELFYIVEGEQRIEGFLAAAGITPYRLDYETLIADKPGTVTGVLRALSCTEAEIGERLPALADKTRRHSYDDWDQAQARFVGRYAAELQQIAAARHVIDVARLRHDLAERHSLASL